MRWPASRTRSRGATDATRRPREARPRPLRSRASGGPMVRPVAPADMDARYRETLVQMMRSQAYRELAAAQMFGYGLRYVPELKWIKFMSWHIQEEVEHY